MTTPDAANWFSYVIQGGSFAALIWFMIQKGKQDEAREKKLGELLEGQAKSHKEATEAVMRDSEMNRKTFEAELARYRHERDTRENSLVMRLDLKDQQMIDFLKTMHGLPPIVKP